MVVKLVTKTKKRKLTAWKDCLAKVDILTVFQKQKEGTTMIELATTGGCSGEYKDGWCNRGGGGGGEMICCGDL